MGNCIIFEIKEILWFYLLDNHILLEDYVLQETLALLILTESDCHNTSLPLQVFLHTFAILATRDTQLAKRWRLSCKPRMRSADSIPIVSTSVCFLPLKMYTGITKILEFEYKTGMF